VWCFGSCVSTLATYLLCTTCNYRKGMYSKYVLSINFVFPNYSGTPSAKKPSVGKADTNVCRSFLVTSERGPKRTGATQRSIYSSLFEHLFLHHQTPLPQTESILFRETGRLESLSTCFIHILASYPCFDAVNYQYAAPPSGTETEDYR
jgi:hypothetical protein